MVALILDVTENTPGTNVLKHVLSVIYVFSYSARVCKTRLKKLASDLTLAYYVNSLITD
jgi:hypothetical protein